MSHLVSVSANKHLHTSRLKRSKRSKVIAGIAQLIAPELGWGASTRSCRIFRAAFRSSLSRAKRGTWPDHLGPGMLRHKQMQLTNGRAKLFLRRCNDLDQRWPCDQTCWDRRLETGGCFIRLRDWNLRPLSKFQPKWIYCGTAASKYRPNMPQQSQRSGVERLNHMEPSQVKSVISLATTQCGAPPWWLWAQKSTEPRACALRGIQSRGYPTVSNRRTSEMLRAASN